jgi:hypothetical protein
MKNNWSIVRISFYIFAQFVTETVPFVTTFTFTSELRITKKNNIRENNILTLASLALLPADSIC